MKAELDIALTLMKFMIMQVELQNENKTLKAELDQYKKKYGSI